MNLHPRLHSGDALMVVAAVWSVSRGVGYLPMFSPEKLAGPLAVVTLNSQDVLTALALAWLAAAGMCFVGVWRRKAVWIVGVIAMCIAWSATFWIGWGLSIGHGGPPSRDWYSAANYSAALLGLGLWLWDRQRRTRRSTYPLGDSDGRRTDD